MNKYNKIETESQIRKQQVVARGQGIEVMREIHEGD